MVGCHAVLASLSERYPPLEGRSRTRYSPVCHSTDPLRDFRVRLACVRHAASVDSEPGSNSQVKFACLAANCFNPRSLNCWLFGFNSTGALACARAPVDRSSTTLILDGLCLHVLSSFQRTEVALHRLNDA